MTKTRRARRLPGCVQSTDPDAASRFRLPRLSDEDREAARQARARALGDEPPEGGDAA